MAWFKLGLLSSSVSSTTSNRLITPEKVSINNLQNLIDVIYKVKMTCVLPQKATLCTDVPSQANEWNSMYQGSGRNTTAPIITSQGIGGENRTKLVLPYPVAMFSYSSLRQLSVATMLLGV